MNINQGSFRWDFWGELATNALHSHWISQTDLLKISQEAHELAVCFLPVEAVAWETVTSRSESRLPQEQREGRRKLGPGPVPDDLVHARPPPENAFSSRESNDGNSFLTELVHSISNIKYLNKRTKEPTQSRAGPLPTLSFVTPSEK